jgi:hypothetical protein
MAPNPDTVLKLQHDISQIGALVDRIDITIEKLTEVSTRVSELLAVQGIRLETQEKVSEQLKDLIEKRRVETDTNIRDVYYKVDKVEKDIYGEIESSESKVLEEIKAMRRESTKQHTELKTKVEQLERWMWTVMGGFAVALFIFEVYVKKMI